MTRIHHSRGMSSTRLITKALLPDANDCVLADLEQLSSSQLGDLAAPPLSRALAGQSDTRSVELMRVVGRELQRREHQRG